MVCRGESYYRLVCSELLTCRRKDRALMTRPQRELGDSEKGPIAQPQQGRWSFKRGAKRDILGHQAGRLKRLRSVAEWYRDRNHSLSGSSSFHSRSSQRPEFGVFCRPRVSNVRSHCHTRFWHKGTRIRCQSLIISTGNLCGRMY